MSKFITQIIILFFVSTSLSFAQGDWEKIATMEGGWVVDLLVSPSGTIYANSNVFLYKSDDYGENWEPVLKSVDTLLILDIGLSRDGQGVEAIVVLYASSAFQSDMNLLRSFDQGETWESLALPELDSLRVRGLISLRYGGLYLKVMDEEYNFLFFESTDNAGSFEKMEVNDMVNDFYQAADSTIYALGHSEGFHRRLPGSDEWELLSNLPSTNIRSLSSTEGELLIYDGGPWDDETKTFYRSTDRGDTWNQFSDPVFPNSNTEIIGLSNGDYLIFNKTYDNAPNYVYSVHRLPKGSDEFEMLADLSGIEHKTPIELPNGAVMTGNDYGAYYSENFIDWEERINGLNAMPLMVALLNEDNSIIAGSMNGELYEYDPGSDNFTIIENFEKANGDFPFKSLTFTKSGDIALISKRGLAFSMDKGKSWRESNFTFPDEAPTYMIEREEGEFFAISDYAVARSTDYGESWEEVYTEIKGSESRLSFIGTDKDGDLLVGSSNGLFSLDENYEPSEILFEGRNIISIRYIENFGYVAIEATGDSELKAIRSRDDGQTWDEFPLQDIFQDSYGIFFSYLISNTGDVYVVHIEGTFHLPINGSEWENVFPNDLMLSVSQNDEATLIATSFYGEVYKKQVATSVEELGDAGNYVYVTPNPATDELTINFGLNAPGKVDVRVINITGIEVLSMESGYLPRGENKVRIDASSLNQGIYFYRITSNGETQSGKFVVNR